MTLEQANRVIEKQQALIQDLERDKKMMDGVIQDLCDSVQFLKRKLKHGKG